MGRTKRRANSNNNNNNNNKNVDVMAAVLITAVCTALQNYPGAMAAEYTVGDATLWDFAPTSSYYSDWASGLKFLPGDKLVFKYLPSAHNVQEVTEADYALCNSVNPIAEYESGNDIITLPKPGTHFYICGFLGHCDQGGMKMKAMVVSPKASAPSPSPSPSKPPASSQLPSPMTSIIPQLPGGETPSPPHGRGRGHGAPPPAAAPISTPGGHSRGAPSLVPVRVTRLLLLALGLASASLFC